MGPREKCASSKISAGILSNTSRCTTKDSKNSFQFHGFSATTFRVNLIFCIVLQHPVIIPLSSCVIAHPLNFKLRYQRQTIFTASSTTSHTIPISSIDFQCYHLFVYQAIYAITTLFRKAEPLPLTPTITISDYYINVMVTRLC